MNATSVFASMHVLLFLLIKEDFAIEEISFMF